MSCRHVIDRSALVGTIALGVSFASAPATANELEALQRQIEALESKVRALESQRDVRPQPASNAVTAGATNGSFKLPGSDTSVTVGGYVKLDAAFSNPSAGVGSTADLFLQANAIPVGPEAGDDEHNR